MNGPLDIVFVGLSLSSSWGNGHATTYRSLLRGLNELGHRVTFLERDVPWYAGNRDLSDPDFCNLIFYTSPSELAEREAERLRAADVVVVGSFVPDGVKIIDMLSALCSGYFCFYDIDTPVTMAKLAAGDKEYITARQLVYFDVYFSFTGGPTLTRLCKEYGARHAEALYCSVDETQYFPTGEKRLWDLGYLGTYSSDRQLTLERLLIDVARNMPERRFVVAGSQYPAHIDWPANVDRIAHVAPADHASFYSRQRFTLNVTRADMIAAGWAPSVRLFEAAACGCPVISDIWPGLDELFPFGRAIEVAASTPDVCRILREVREPQRLSMAGEARRIVLASHTGRARAQDFIDCLDAQPHLGRSPSRKSAPSGSNHAAQPK